MNIRGTYQSIQLFIVFTKALALDHDIKALYAGNEQGCIANDAQGEAGDFHIAIALL